MMGNVAVFCLAFLTVLDFLLQLNQKWDHFSKEMGDVELVA